MECQFTILDVINEAVDIVDIIKPVYNFKAGEDYKPWEKRGK